MLTTLVFPEQCDFTEDQTAGRPSLTPVEVTLGRGTRPRAPSPPPAFSSAPPGEHLLGSLLLPSGSCIFFSHSFFLPSLLL